MCWRSIAVLCHNKCAWETEKKWEDRIIDVDQASAVTMFWFWKTKWREKRSLICQVPRIVAWYIKDCGKQIPLHALKNKCLFIKVKMILTYDFFNEKGRERAKTPFLNTLDTCFGMNSIWLHRVGQLCLNYYLLVQHRTDGWYWHFDINGFEPTRSIQKLHPRIDLAKQSGFWNTPISILTSQYSRSKCSSSLKLWYCSKYVSSLLEK